MTENSLPSPALLQRHLHGVNYPATRDELLDRARSECARVIGTLMLLPDRTYSRPTEVNKAFGEIARQAIEDIQYPAGRTDLVQTAQEHHAEMVIIEALSEIPDRDYDSPDAVVLELVEV